MRFIMMTTYMLGPFGWALNITDRNVNKFENTTILDNKSNDSGLRFSTAELVTEGIILTMICFTAVVGNTCMWIIVIRNKDLRTVTNSFLLTLASADLMVSVVNMPVTILTIFKGEWVFSDEACTALGFTNMLTLVTSVLSLCNISINRYIMVCRPTKFKTIYTKRNAAFMIAVSTSTAFVLSLPPIFGWTEYSYAPIQSICFSDWAQAPSYAIFMITCCFGCPLIVMLICNILILREVRRRNRRVMNKKKIHFKAVVNVIAQAKTLNTTLSTSTFAQLGDASSGSDATTIYSQNEAMSENLGCLNQTEDDFSNPQPIKTFQIHIASTSTLDVNESEENQIKKKRKPKKQPVVVASQSEVHLARMLCIVVVVFGLCWSPYCVSMLFNIFWEDIFLPRSFHMTTLLIGYFNSLCNPIIYGVLNKRFGKEFRKILCFWRQ
ncbi:thyrotropin-releasing hormone receptor-like [Saccostrea echinata]|uniref:thyrotropin-releasing hormone receptor-like n=1 Tax=Saccostrea echinata TaxID=191078 RepID=UPI002A805262|nr:thyrotropin-releasing hormone receptor-like [Saccostrea echinata]